MTISFLRAASRPTCSMLFALFLLPLISNALTEGDYTYTVADGQASITGFNMSYSGPLSITNTLGGYPVTSISSNAFYKRSSLTSVTIPDSVTAIGDSAFYYCYRLTSVTIPGSITAIGNAAFSSIHNLTNLVIGAGVKSIGDSAFYYCSNLASVTIPTSVTSIGNSTFYGCSGLTSVTIPNSVTNIGDSAFYYCSNLASVAIPASVTSIGNKAFYGSSKLTSVAIPNSVTTIGDCAFRSCSSLRRILFQSTPPTLGGTQVFTGSPAKIYYLPAFASNWPSSFGYLPTLCWNPTVQPDASFGFTSERFSFNITGTPDIPVVVEATTNLLSGVWTPLTNATLGTSASLYFTDPSSTNRPSGFYRIVWP